MLAHLRTITFCHVSRELPRRIELRKQGRKQSNAMISCGKSYINVDEFSREIETA